MTAETLVVAGERDFILAPMACGEVADAVAGAGLEIFLNVAGRPATLPG